MALRVQVSSDGGFDLLGDSVCLLGCYPCIGERSVRPVRVETAGDTVSLRPFEAAAVLR